MWKTPDQNYFYEEKSETTQLIGAVIYGFFDVTDLAVVTNPVIDLYKDPVADLMSQDGFAQRRVDADAALHGVAAHGGHQFVGLFFIVIFYINSDCVE